jgi:hypothetical protein
MLKAEAERCILRDKEKVKTLISHNIIANPFFLYREELRPNNGAPPQQKKSRKK